jgi:hypothetical protein
MAIRQILSRRRILLILALTAALAVAGILAGLRLSTASAATVHAQESTSANWAGYVVEGKQFSSVSGSWVVPTANSSSQGYSAFWVGLGGSGSGSQSLEQVGTESDDVGGQTSYYAWYELVPSAPVQLNLSVHPGDRMSGKVSANGTNVTVSISDLTTGKSVTKALQMSNPDTSSAEWVAEAPSASTQAGSYQVLPLADFGKVTFTGASATAGGHTGSISDSNWTAQKVQLASSTGTGGFPGGPGGIPGAARVAASIGSAGEATTSSLSSGGSSFSVSWQSSSSGQSAPSGSSGGGYGYGGGGFGPGGNGYGVGPGGFGPGPAGF